MASRPAQSQSVRASAVWPWMAQIGPARRGRGGAHTYDWIENLLGLDVHSADRVLLDHHHPEVGDTLGYGKNRKRRARAGHSFDHVRACPQQASILEKMIDPWPSGSRSPVHSRSR
jgi:hypothetical protein